MLDADFGAAFESLKAGFPHSRNVAQPTAALYWDRFRETDALVFARAVELILERQDHFPTMKTLGGFVREAQAEHAPTSAEWDRAGTMTAGQARQTARDRLREERSRRMVEHPAADRAARARARKFAYAGGLCLECGDVGTDQAWLHGWAPDPTCPRCRGAGWDPDREPDRTGERLQRSFLDG